MNLNRFQLPDVREHDPERAERLAEWRAEIRRDELIEAQLDCPCVIIINGFCKSCGKRVE